MPTFTDVMKKFGDVVAHIVAVAEEHPELVQALVQVVQAAADAGAKK